MRNAFLIGPLLLAAAFPTHAQVPVGMFTDVEGTCIVQALPERPCAIGHTLASGQMVELVTGSTAGIVLNSGATFSIIGESVVEVYDDGVFVITGELPIQSAETWSSAPALIQAGQRFEVGAARMRGFGDDSDNLDPLPHAPADDANFSSRLIYAMTLLRHGEDEEGLARLRQLLDERPDAEFIRRVLADYRR